MRSLSRVLFSAVFFIAAVAVGVWLSVRPQPKADISLAVNAEAHAQILPLESETAAKAAALSQSSSVTDNSDDDVNIADAKAEDYKTWARQILNNLPRREDLQNAADADSEITPQVIREGAADVAALFEYASQNPVVKKAAVEVFKECAEQSEGLDPVRAYCYAKAVRLNLELGGDFWDPQSVSDAIKNLARDL